MASIQSSIQLYDMVSAPLMDITSALIITTKAFNNMQPIANNSFDISYFEAVSGKLNQVTVDAMELSNAFSKIEKPDLKIPDVPEAPATPVQSSAQSPVNKIISTVADCASLENVVKVLDISDQLTQTTAKLNMMTGGLAETEKLQDMIYAASERSRTSYMATADIVTNLGQGTGDTFKSNQEIVRFAENLNKMFITAGASQEEITSASSQLTQAMGSGVLSGEDLNSIFASAPNIIKTIADYMNVPVGKISELASEGKITGETVKNALLGATSEVDTQFNNTTATWGQVWSSIGNNSLIAFEPVIGRLNDIKESDAFNSLIDGITGALSMAANVVLNIFDMIGQVGKFMSDNWSIMAPIICAVATAMAVYAGYLAITNGLELISKGLKLACVVALFTYAAATGSAAAATAAQTTAQGCLNAAQLASPATWMLIIIIAIIAAIYAIVAAINNLTGSSISATGLIMAAFSAVGAIIGNVFMGVLEIIIGVVEFILNILTALANFFGNLFNDPIGAITNLFFDLADIVLGLIEKIASGLDFIFGSKLADTVSGWRTDLAIKAESEVKKRSNGTYEDKVSAFDLNKNLSDLGLNRERFKVEDAYNKGYGMGEGIENSIANFDLSNLFKNKIPDDSNSTNENKINDIYSYVNENNIPGTTDNNTANNIAETADNTAKVADSVDISSEDLTYLRDIAERDVINRYTTAEIKVDMKNDMKVNSSMDLDGVVNYLASGVNEAMEKAAEGVHR